MKKSLTWPLDAQICRAPANRRCLLAEEDAILPIFAVATWLPLGRPRIPLQTGGRASSLAAPLRHLGHVKHDVTATANPISVAVPIVQPTLTSAAAPASTAVATTNLQQNRLSSGRETSSRLATWLVSTKMHRFSIDVHGNSSGHDPCP
jgi:hypothetical protein